MNGPQLDKNQRWVHDTLTPDLVARVVTRMQAIADHLAADAYTEAWPRLHCVITHCHELSNRQAPPPKAVAPVSVELDDHPSEIALANLVTAVTGGRWQAAAAFANILARRVKPLRDIQKAQAPV